MLSGVQVVIVEHILRLRLNLANQVPYDDMVNHRVYDIREPIEVRVGNDIRQKHQI